MATPTLQQQIVFQLSWWSSLSAKVTPAPGETLEHATYVELNQLLTNPPQGSPITTPWNLVWGPYVLESDTSHLALNTMYVAQSTTDPTQYVVAIAGTNPRSVFDWIVEDALVGIQIPWLYGLFSAPDAKISLGTAVGLTILQNGKPAGGIPGAGQTLREFLGALDKTGGINLTVTGHSLGGALAPTVALWLHDVRPLWDPAGEATIATMPVAGPTPGNGAYAEYADKTLPIARFNNALDVVPHAWHENDLRKIPLLYAPAIISPGVFAATGVAMALAAGGDYTQLSADTPVFPGTVQKDKINPHKSSIDNFLAQVAWQHIYAYSNYFNLKDVTSQAISAALTARAALPSSGLLSAAGEVLRHAASIPLAGVPTPVPGRHDPAVRTFVDQVVSELMKHATPAQQGLTFSIDGGIHTAAPADSH